MSESIFRETLEKARLTNQLVSVYSERAYPYNFAAGFVGSVTDEQICLRSLSEHGLYDGFVVRRAEDIFRVETNTRYLENLQLLWQAREQKHPPDFLPVVQRGDNLFYEVLRAAHTHNLAVSFRLGTEGDVAGWVVKLGFESVVIDAVNEDGDGDGQSFCALEDIARLNCDDEDLQDLRVLRDWHQMKPPF